MEISQHSLTIATPGRGALDITEEINRLVRKSGIITGLAHVFIHHTSASLILCENADPDVRRDLETFMTALAVDGDPRFRHRSEGPDDMPAHIRTTLTNTGLGIPVSMARCGLGTWQGVYLWEHRTSPHRRRITVTLQGHVEAD